MHSKYVGLAEAANVPPGRNRPHKKKLPHSSSYKQSFTRDVGKHRPLWKGFTTPLVGKNVAILSKPE